MKKKREKQQNFGEKTAPSPLPTPAGGAAVPAGRGEAALLGRYLLEASVLDVQLLGVDEVKELPVLLPAGQAGQSGTGGDRGAGEATARQRREQPGGHGQRLPGAHLSMLLKVYCVPCLVSISKSKERVVVVPRAKLTKEISSKRMWTGGLCT